MNDPQVELEQFTAEDREHAALTAQAIELLVGDISLEEQKLAQSWLKLGREMVWVRDRRYWILWGHRTFADYVRALGERVNSGRTRLMEAYSVATHLLPVLGEETLEQMGLTKAKALTVEFKRTGNLSQELIDKASDPSVSGPQFREELFRMHNITPQYAGRYRDLGGIYATDEEWAETEQAFNCAVRTDPVIAKDLPEWARLKEILHRLAVTYLVTFQREVEGLG